MQDAVKPKQAHLRLRLGERIPLGARLPKKLKPYARYALYGLRALFGGPRGLNRFRYLMSVSNTEHINFVPPVLAVTINSTCNLRCPNCFYVLIDGEHAFEGGAMIRVDDFKAVIEKYGDKTEIVFLSGGEPLAHPRLDQLANIVKSKSKRISLRISTNGVFIDRTIDVLKSFDYINVSMDGYDYESFKKYRGGTPREFDKIVQGLSLLRENNIPFSNSFVLSDENLHEVNSMLEFCYGSRPDVVVLHSINPHGSKDFTPLTSDNEKVRKILKEICSRNDYPFDIVLPVIFDTQSRGFIEAKCTQQWYYAAFNDKGDMSYCCHMNHDESIGNIFKGYDFNSDKMQEFRQRMISHEYPKDACLFCHRRFTGQDYGRFYAKQKKWIVQGAGGSGVKLDNMMPLVTPFGP
jgi:MoaA/NifB/PqqE/SkfB family radical SAM enzyme